MAFLHEVFYLSGVPTVTFVQPTRYQDILVSMRTPGRCMVLEGPSGIGKTTIIEKIIEKLNLQNSSLSLSARKVGDLPLIESLPDMNDIGTVIIDDFHRLSDETKSRVGDFMKILADSSSTTSKLILIGINKAGNQLVKYAHDLGLRIDVFRLESNPDDKVEDLVTLGEKELNVTFDHKRAIAERAEGSFQIAQLLCHKLCTSSGITETQDSPKQVKVSLDFIVEEVMVDLGRIFKEPATTFARGSKLRKEGRAPYLHILRWLAKSEEWSLDLGEAMNRYPANKASINQVLEKGHLLALLNDPEKIDLLSPYFHFEPTTNILSVEDPRLMFYLKNIVWRAFTRSVGFNSDYFESAYDFALSFAGTERAHAKRIHELLNAREVSCFYDHDEQHRIIAAHVEEYLAPIYRSEARYVVPLLSVNYPTRIWTKFESDAFRERFGQGGVIPIRYTDTQPGWYSEEQTIGSLSLDPSGDVEAQIQDIVETLCRRLIEDRSTKADDDFHDQSSPKIDGISA
ncbi:hypothetical protein FHT12_000547 [Xanthomonas campestris]|uniref:TIR domain-containing protein n=1 Tax=Xanthomonas euroxanthea TaxID=2259622 RepID=UPI000CED9A18|nr:TIR domain-containing protein [Xanthomonas euroxanthea]NIJ91889.1 hypothetical protein [Xanthomonas euroxanthea]PPT33354.1 hypothetical protein XaCFBP7622_01410 [Xanthomonas arboricola]